MKKALHILLVCFGLAMLFSFAGPERKTERAVSRVWKTKEFVLQDVELPDSLKSDYTLLQKVFIEDQLVGYVCYTTAFGCRIGGCAAPKNANAQSYETFDYIVIYDTDLKIKRVDIAHYSGDYGYEICNPRWLKQFIGATSGFKLNDNIDGIAGATVSATFLIDDLNVVGSDLRKVLLTDEMI